MNKIEKLLQKLDAKTRNQIEQALLQIYSLKLEGLNVKKIKGAKGIFRVRVGRHRIIYRQAGKNINLITITKRDEKTYKDF